MSVNFFNTSRRLTHTRRRSFITALMTLSLAFCSLASADEFIYSGMVTAGEGALAVLIPTGSPLSGPIGITTTPGGTTMNTAAITDVQLLMTSSNTGNVLFCFFLNTTCPPLGTQVPIVEITALNLTFASNGCPIAGTIDLLTFSPTFMVDIPVTLDVTTGSFHAESEGLGSVDGVGSFNCAADSDTDGVIDDLDNCTVVPNADQRDTDADNYGNACDPDLDNNNVVNFGDISAWVPFFNTAATGNEDFNGDGFANFGDYSLFPAFFQQPPGPSGLAP